MAKKKTAAKPIVPVKKKAGNSGLLTGGNRLAMKKVVGSKSLIAIETKKGKSVAKKKATKTVKQIKKVFGKKAKTKPVAKKKVANTGKKIKKVVGQKSKAKSVTKKKVAKTVKPLKKVVAKNPKELSGKSNPIAKKKITKTVKPLTKVVGKKDKSKAKPVNKTNSAKARRPLKKVAAGRPKLKMSTQKAKQKTIAKNKTDVAKKPVKKLTKPKTKIAASKKGEGSPRLTGSIKRVRVSSRETAIAKPKVKPTKQVKPVVLTKSKATSKVTKPIPPPTEPKKQLGRPKKVREKIRSNKEQPILVIPEIKIVEQTEIKELQTKNKKLKTATADITKYNPRSSVTLSEGEVPDTEHQTQNALIPNDNTPPTAAGHIIPLTGLYENWFLDYASYVILERAVPAVEDGLKPVQRRILHAMKEMDDGRLNKVANIIGQSMQYHPHGDASIGDAIVNLGQKELLIDTQGNWGDINTGDSAAAPRYIEARLSKFALDVAFNPQTTKWQASYDGRKKEPIALPMKFPLLLAQGVEGIAVGLSTKVLPHNFCELIKGSIDILKEKKVHLYPDFPTGGLIDVANYNDGRRGGKVRVRAKIEELDKKTLVIREIPYGCTTTSVIDSILKANDSGKIKIRKLNDNTARNVEIVVHLAPGVSPDITIDALYAFTDCEVSISPNACVIVDNKPQFITATDLLQISTANTLELLKKELEIKLNELDEDWHYSSLEKIFIEKRIYRDIEECESWDEVLTAIDKGLAKYKKLFRRDITMEDIASLTEIRIKRISKFDSFKADEHIKAVEEGIAQVKHDLANLREFAVKYFENLLKKYGKERERKTEIRTFDNIKAQVVAIANQKLYVNRAEGFVGIGLKKDEYVCDCSELDDVIIFRKDGVMQVTRVADKTFVGKDIIHVDVFRKNNERMVYNMVYQDGKDKLSMVKRFNVTGITRDKEYDLSKGNKGSHVIYFSANANSEAEIVTVFLSPHSSARQKIFDFDFGMIAIKGRSSQGNILSRHLVKAIKFKEKGASTIGGVDIWYDETIGRLNTDEHGRLLGSFDTKDSVLVLYKDGSYELTTFELTNRYEPKDILLLEKYEPETVISAIHFDAEAKNYYVKRFHVETQTQNKKFIYINEAAESKLLLASTLKHPLVKLTKGRKKNESITETLDLSEFIDVKGWKANGNRLATGKDYLDVSLLQPKPELEKAEPKIGKEVVFEVEKPDNLYMGMPKLEEFKEYKPAEKKVPVNPKDIKQGNLF